MPYYASKTSTTTRVLYTTLSGTPPSVTVQTRQFTAQWHVSVTSSVVLSTAKTNNTTLLLSRTHMDVHGISSTSSVTSTAHTVWPSNVFVTSYSGVYP